MGKGKNKKESRGGSRPGAGHPTKAEGVKRVYLTAMVHPETLANIDAEKSESGKSRGEIIDDKFYLPSKSGR